MRRKLVLASSFVITAMGCAREDVHPTPNPPAVDPTTAATPTTSASPTPTPTPPPSDGPEVRIEHLPDGSCLRIVIAKCPPGLMCNPPPPLKVPCPDSGT